MVCLSVECLLSKCKALSSNSSTVKKRKEKISKKKSQLEKIKIIFRNALLIKVY
jgi:hypothetical protein